MKILKRLIDVLLDPKIFFLLIAFLLIQLWFSKNILFGGVELGVPTYTPGKTLGQIIWLWWEALGPGVSFQTISPAIPLYAYMALLERVGLGAIGIQKILFFIIIYVQGLGVSFLFRKIFPQSGKLGILAGLFYIFNPFMMTYVWHRFIYGGIILSAALPLLIYFYLQLLEKRKFKFIFFFLLTSLLANYMYSAVAPVIAIWLAIFVIFLSEIVINRKNIKKITQYTFLTGILFISWILTNIWWMYPLIGIKTVFSVFSISGDVNTLIALSEKSTINYVIRGINPYYLFYEQDWGNIYQNLLFQSLSWIPVLFILAGLVLKSSRKKMWSMILLFLVGIFVAKGAAAPLGDFTKWIYSHFFFLGVIRNPFEKLGLLVILPASIITVIGINNLWNLSRSIYLKILIIILIIGCGIYVWPMWSDKLFGSDKYPLFFTLPTDYPEVSNFLSEQLKLDNGKILHLPISESDSATYNWQYSYNGTEIASSLFPGSSISKFLYISFIDQLLQESARIFHTTNYDLQRKIISNFGVKYIVLNRNLNWYYRKVDNPQLVERILDLSPDLKVIKETTNLKVYKFISETDPSVFLATNLSLLSGVVNSGSEKDFTLTKTFEDNGVFLQEFQRQQIPRGLLKEEIILPRRVFASDFNADKNPNVMIPRPYVKHLPGSFDYQLAIFKEKIELWLAPSYEKPMKVLLLTQKRLMESKQLKEKKKEKEFNESINKYTGYLDEAINQIKKMSDEELEIDSKIILKIALDEEVKALSDFKNNANSIEIKSLIEKDIRKILDFRKEKGLDVYYLYPDTNPSIQSSVNTYQFFISNETKADLILATPNFQFYGLDKDETIKISLDGTLKDVTLKKNDNQNWFSLGGIELKPGIHEIALPNTAGQILLKTENFVNKTSNVELGDQNNLITITTSKEKSWVEYIIPNYNPDKTYILSFYYRIIKGAPPEVQFWQNSDEYMKKDTAKIIRNMPDNSYDFGWGYAEFSISTNNNTSISLDRGTTDLKIRLTIPYWNNCESMNFRRTKLCNNLRFREMYNKPSSAEIRDLRIDESFTADIFLDRTLGNNLVSPTMTFKKNSPVEYSVETFNNNPYFYVVLNEGFHSGWKVILNSPTEVVSEKNHFLANGYANGWLINRSGKLSFKIEFTPQEYFYKAIFISVVGYIAIILVLLRKIIARK